VILESKNIPKTPGCYLFKDEKDQIIYVGKSKFLPKRVKSYFQKNHKDKKTQSLVESINDVEFIITESESEALVVEENLIKLYKPRYNIKGKDDKTIRLTLQIIDEEFPRVELERSSDVKGEIIAQFTSSKSAREIYKLIHQVFPLRSCSYELNNTNIESNKFKPCLEHQIGNCLAPCLGIKKFIYTKIINDIKKLFNFDNKGVLSSLIKKRNYFSKNLEFEKANDTQHRINALNELIKNIEPLRLYKVKEELREIKEFLNLKRDPLIIESYDNSHFSGKHGVATSIRFVMGKPEKSSYRKFIIKEGKVGDDYSSFEEVLSRRFKRIISEKIQLPDLIIMDGGKTQVNVAKKVLNDLNIVIDIIGVSKDDNHKAKWIHLTSGKQIDIFEIPNYSILGKISEEVHRFTINFHKQRRDKI
jgi:excinuclease ABC subunit C